MVVGVDYSFWYKLVEVVCLFLSKVGEGNVVVVVMKVF